MPANAQTRSKPENMTVLPAVVVVRSAASRASPPDAVSSSRKRLTMKSP